MELEGEHNKTKVMIFERGRKTYADFNFDGKKLDLVESLKYLGLTLYTNGGWFRTQKNLSQYELQVSLPDGTTKLMTVSRVIYMIQQRTLNIPTRNEDGVTIEMSHLCHNSLCVNPTHLILEEKITNIERNQ